MNLKTAAMTMAISLSCIALNAQAIKLPTPVQQGGATLNTALMRRSSNRDFAPRELPPQMLSSLLWAANGINRPDGHRTAPTGLNVQDIDIYVILPNGAYLYDHKANLLQPIKAGDFRKAAGSQPFVATSPVNLIYVQNLDKAMKADEKNTARHGGLHAGAIMQNVYLFCAANGLATVARDSMDRAKLTEILSLSPRQSIMLAQTVGFPAKPLSIGAEEAKRTALTHAGLPGGSVITDFKCELDKEDGIQVYEVEFKCNGFEYDYEIDAATGKVLKAEKERD